MNSPITSRRVLNSSNREIENGKEFVLTAEVLRANGTKYLYDGLARRTETDKCISVVATCVIHRFASQQDNSPSGTDVLTCLIDTKKGETEGAYRWDTVQFTFITSNGIDKRPAQRVKLPTANREGEFSVEEIMEKVFTSVNLR